MNDEENKPETNEPEDKHGALRDWGIDVEAFETRAKQSLKDAKDDLAEITGTLRATLVAAKDVVVGLQKSRGSVAEELKGGFERAWKEIDQAFSAARQKVREAREEAPQQASDASPAGEAPVEETQTASEDAAPTWPRDNTPHD